MRTLIYDFETYYDRDYSLRRMSPAEYILDPRFDAIGCAFKWGVKGKAFWVDGPELQAFFGGIDPSDVMSVAHNAMFDASIAAWRYGFVPKLMVDTLGVSRALLGHTLKSHALDKLGEHLGIGRKTGALPKVLGMHLADIKAAGLYDEFVDYALNDADLCAAIFEQLVLSGQFPASELVIMDGALRCTVEPKFHINSQLLRQHLAEVQTQKSQQLAMAMLAGADGKSTLMSNQMFADLLMSLGVEPPTKISPLTHKVTFAFAKSDPEFTDLLEHDDPRVQAVVAARLGHKSTIEETRTERFIAISELHWPDRQRARMPIPLRYAGAHTHRFSGDWKLNVQNMGRGSKLRDALEAPDGYTVFAPDASQIEARGVAAFCGQNDLVRQFAGGEDVYASFGSMVFGFPVNKKQYPVERFIGKTGVLGLGYSVGWAKFVHQVKVQSLSMLGQTIELSEQEGRRVVDLYRATYSMIPIMWRTLDRAIDVLAYGGDLRIGPVVFRKGEILLPNGLKLKYVNLRKDEEGTWRYDYGTVLGKRLYGGALLENIIQALARIIVMDASSRIRERTHRVFNMQCHDELVYVLPTEQLAEFSPIVMEEMTRRPDWLPTWPLAAEAGTGRTYGEAK